MAMRAYLAGLLGALTTLALVGVLALALVLMRARSQPARVDRAFMLREIDAYEANVYRPIVGSAQGEFTLPTAGQQRPPEMRAEVYGERHPQLGAYIAWCLAQSHGGMTSSWCYRPYWLRTYRLSTAAPGQSALDDFLAAR
jgi:hypothetical protein